MGRQNVQCKPDYQSVWIASEERWGITADRPAQVLAVVSAEGTGQASNQSAALSSGCATLHGKKKAGTGGSPHSKDRKSFYELACRHETSGAF